MPRIFPSLAVLLCRGRDEAYAGMSPCPWVGLGDVVAVWGKGGSWWLLTRVRVTLLSSSATSSGVQGNDTLTYPFADCSRSAFSTA